jgi:hypothetical protein
MSDLSKLDNAAREARNRYYREWRKKNPEKVKESNERYWAKKAAEMATEEKEGETNANADN